jgi:trimeric autotransporter adhesin
MKRATYFLSSLTLIMGRASGQEYVISTFAGGAPPPTPAIGLQLAIGEVTGLVPDPFGALYFIARNSVFKLDRDGTVTLVAGTSDRPGTTGEDGAAVAAHLNGPATLALDLAGNLFIAEAYEVLRVSTEGSISRFAGRGNAGSPGSPGDGGPAANATLGQLLSLATDSSGNLYISDTYNYRIRRVSLDGLISTFAGGNNQSMAGDGDGGPAIKASIYPQAIAIDGTGNVYIADNLHFAIRKITPEGVITTVAGSGAKGTSGDGGPATQAQFTLIWGVAVDAEGDIYISDLGNPPRIREVSAATGIITTAAGDGTVGFSGDGGPAILASMYAGQIAGDAEGELFIADDGNDRIREVTPDGIIHTIAGASSGLGQFFSGDGGPAASAQLSAQDVAVDMVGNLYIDDLSNNRIRQVSNGVINTIAGGYGQGSSGDGGPALNAGFTHPGHLAVDSSRNVYIADGVLVRKISTNGVITTVAGNDEAPGDSGDGGPAVEAGFSEIGGLAVDKSGNLYISDSNVDDCGPSFYTVIRKVSSDGTISTFAQIGGGALAVDANGNLYHGWGSAVQKIAPDGTVTNFAGISGEVASDSGGGGPATSARLRRVTALAVDAAGSVYIADGDNDVNTIRKVSLDGIIATIAGVNGPAGYSGDDGPATNGMLNTPMGMAVDAAGNVYVADTGNRVVRILQPLRPRLTFSVLLELLDRDLIAKSGSARVARLPDRADGPRPTAK